MHTCTNRGYQALLSDFFQVPGNKARYSAALTVELFIGIFIALIFIATIVVAVCNAACWVVLTLQKFSCWL